MVLTLRSEQELEDALNDNTFVGGVPIIIVKGLYYSIINVI